jgi:phospholipid/cholesterol/gamma-HCH transport system substrate-binding protein
VYFQVKRIEFKVGLFVVVTTLLIAASIGYVAYKKGLFAKEHIYTLSSKTGENLTVGVPVVVLGFTIGRVSALELSDRGIVTVRIKISEQHTGMIRDNSTFMLEKPFIGTPRLVVKTADLHAPPLAAGKVPEITVSSDINEIIKRAEPIIEKADNILGDMRKITKNIADPEGEVSSILRDAGTLTHRFSTRNSLLAMVVDDPESIKSVHGSLRSLKNITEKVDKILQRFDGMAGKTDEQLYGQDGVLPQFRDILRDIQSKLVKLNVTFDNVNRITSDTADSAKDLKQLRNELDAAIYSIGSLSEQIDRMLPCKQKPEIKLP